MKTTKSLDNVLETAKGFKLQAIHDINLALNDIASKTGSLNAKIVAAKTALRYNEEAAINISSNLSYIAHKTRDSEAILAAATMIGKYSEKTARNIAYWLSCFSYFIRDAKDIVETANIMSLGEIVKTLEVYDEGTCVGHYKESITSRLLEFAYKTRDAKTTSKLARIISPDGDTLKKYSKETATRIARGLLAIALTDGGLKAAMTVAKTIGVYSGEETVDDIVSDLSDIANTTQNLEAIMTAATTIREYDRKIGKDIASYLSDIAYCTTDPKIIIMSAKTIGKYNEETAGYIAEKFSEFLHYHYTSDNTTFIKLANIMSLDDIVDTVGRYKGKAVNTIIQELFFIARFTPEATIPAAKTIGKYNEEGAITIAYLLENYSRYTRDAESTITTCNLVNKVGSSLFDLLSINDIKKMHDKGLGKLIERDYDLDNIVAYLKSDEELTLPTKDNIKDYNKVVADHLLKEYGIQKEVKSNQLLMLYSITITQREALAKLINNSCEKDRKIYSINLVGEKEPKEGNELELDRKKLPYYSLISVIGSKKPSNENDAISIISEILGEKTVNRARNAFNSHYKHLRKEIIAYVNNNDITGALKLLKDTGDEAINDVISASEYRSLSSLKGKNILGAVESNNPLDYDSRVQIACVYLPRSYEEGIFNYCNDERFKLVRYEVNGNVIGSAICYLEDDNFLVDSVEGYRTFRKKGIFDAVYKDLVSRAKEYGAKRIIFSIDGYNDTPRKFIENIKRYGLKLDKIKMSLDTEGYLEANKEKVQGYLLDFSNKKKRITEINRQL